MTRHDAWRALAASIPRPRAILIASAHWETGLPMLTGRDRLETIHDFSGFPDELYRIRYDAPGAPEIASRALALLRDAGYTAAIDGCRGIDHGAWVPLRYMYPDRDVPVAQISVQPALGTAHHLRLGEALAPLADEGVLVIGSGHVTHNLRDWFASRHDSQALDYVPKFAAVAQRADRRGRPRGGPRLSRASAVGGAGASDRRAFPAAFRCMGSCGPRCTGDPRAGEHRWRRARDGCLPLRSSMNRLSRRQFIAVAAAMGATMGWADAKTSPSSLAWRERRDLFTEGVASGDPATDSVLLWTRYSAGGTAEAVPLTVEVAEDPAFERVVATARTRALAAADHTCRVLIGGLRPGQIYWYRFATERGEGSRLGRTRTAYPANDPRHVRFTFVSCQNVCEGAQNAYRRMIFEDEHAPVEEQLAFVLHLGDFIYEVVDYPEDRPGGRRYDRRLRDRVRFPDGEKIGRFRIAATLADYRTLYRAYLQDPDLQDARARWPFVPIWDNHEFSWMGWQSILRVPGEERPAQTRKVTANQAWFEYQPARVAKSGGVALERFEAPAVKDTPIGNFDGDGLGQEPNNLAAIGSLTGYRSLRWGRHLDLIITDQHSYRSEDPSGRPEASAFSSNDFPNLIPQEAIEILDAGRTYGGGNAPGAIRYGETEVANFRKDGMPQSILGVQQRKWFLEKLRASRATWKVWGSSSGTLDTRVDPQNLPAGLSKPWPGAGYATFGFGDYSSAYVERAAIYDVVRDSGITGFVTVSGDRHSFWAGLAARALPPQAFEPVGAAFITGSVSAPGLVEALEHNLPKDHPLRALYLTDVPGEERPRPAVNMLLRHGVRSCLEYQSSRDLERARRVSNPALAPHLSFIDWGGHGYAALRVSADAVECEFVCIPRPLERSEGVEGGPLRYRVVHRVPLWHKGERPKLEQRVIEGDPGLSI